MKPQLARSQLRLDFEPGLTERYKTFKRCIAAVVYSSKRATFDEIAAACDVSPSTLSKMLNDQENPENVRHLPPDFIPIIMAKTEDYRPAYWLAERFAPDDGSRLDEAIRIVETLAPVFADAVSTIKKAKAVAR